MIVFLKHHSMPLFSFKYSKTSVFHNLITNYSASSSISWLMILIILSGWERLNIFFYTKATNFSSTDPMYSWLCCSSQGRIFFMRTTLFESNSQSIGYSQRSRLFFGTCSSSIFIFFLFSLSFSLSSYLISGSFNSNTGFSSIFSSSLSHPSNI